MNTVLLDAGGVILDETAYERAGAETITEVLRDYVPGYDVDRYWIDLEESVQSFCPHTRDYLFWKYAAGDVDRFVEIKSRYQQAWKLKRPGLDLMNGIEAELRTLASRFSVVLCGQYGGELMDLLDRAGLFRYFRSRRTQDDYGVTKPDPRYFEQICVREELTPEACIMVGDRIDKDIIPAKMLGMGTVFVRTGIYRRQKIRTPDELPDMVLDGVEGMADAITQRWSR